MSRWVSTGLETGTWGVFTPDLIPVLAIFFSLVTVVEGDSDMGGGSASLGLALTVSPLTVTFCSRFGGRLHTAMASMSALCLH